MRSPCDTCPWRLANRGKPLPVGWFSKKNLARLWSKLRRGESMSCHKSVADSKMVDNPKPASEGTQEQECAGAAILQQREFTRLQDALTLEGKLGYQCYKDKHPNGLTKNGARTIVERHMYGDVPFVGRSKNLPVNLNEPGIGHDSLVEWTPR
jgi:hypothetical protein